MIKEFEGMVGCSTSFFTAAASEVRIATLLFLRQERKKPQEEKQVFGSNFRYLFLIELVHSP